MTIKAIKKEIAALDLQLAKHQLVLSTGLHHFFSYCKSAFLKPVNIILLIGGLIFLKKFFRKPLSLKKAKPLLFMLPYKWGIIKFSPFILKTSAWVMRKIRDNIHHKWLSKNSLPSFSKTTSTF